MILNSISCPICDSSDNKIVIKTKDFRLRTTVAVFNIVKCANCGFLFLNPRQPREEVAASYPTDFNKSDQSLLYKILQPFFGLAQQHTVKTFKTYKKNGNVLDIGCGNGSFLLLMQKNGYDVWGIEPNKDAQKYTNSSLVNRISYKEVKECNFRPKTFDIITMFHSLEHVYDVNELLVEVKRIIKDDGILFICVPDANFFEFSLFGPYNYNLEVPRHLYFFTKESLDRLLRKNGFTSKRLLNKSIFELILTPSSFYNGIWNFLEDKKIFANNIIKPITFIPLIIVRLFLCIFFLYRRQNLEMIFKTEDK